MDYLNIFHVSPKLVGGVISQLTTKYVKLLPLSVIRVRMHDSLGMRLYFSTKGKVHITVINHVKGILEAEEEEMNGIAETPAANHLFTVREDEYTLTGMQAKLFQHIVQKILFVSCKSSPDLKTALAFLTTRVRYPDRDYYKKLACTIRYTRATQRMDCTLEAESMDTILLWTEMAYGVCPDLKGHSSGMM